VVRSDPQRLLRGFGKLVAVVVAAGLAGAGVGIALARLTGSGDSSAPASSVAAGATTERASTAAVTATVGQTAAAVLTAKSSPARTPTGARTQTVPTPSTSSRSPRIQVLSARLDPHGSAAAGHVTVRVRVINRGARPLAVEAPALLSGTDEIPRDSDGGSAVRPLLKSLAPGLSATSVLRFTTSTAVAARLDATRHARLRIAKHSIELTIRPASPSG
jgi:hypothetical protein